ncbi:hypothetical protein LF1_56050 [Rubripirellula obstinata]|uniref:Uncharacterized protein n=1 Tax=Rubripirellula obstinata TaxID=406547 RepID=A0A5B1CB45_9BACT|nr:hypothetical protein LF1_56050 [Rubripirellula obstinata]
MALRTESDNGRHHRVAAKDLQANGKANHRHSGACHGYPPSLAGRARANQHRNASIAEQIVLRADESRSDKVDESIQGQLGLVVVPIDRRRLGSRCRIRAAKRM